MSDNFDTINRSLAVASDTLRAAHRTLSNGVATYHTLTTEQAIAIQHSLVDARYAADAMLAERGEQV